MAREFSRKIGLPCAILQICLAVATLTYGILKHDLIIGYHNYTFSRFGFWIPALAIWVVSHTLCGVVGLWAAVKNQQRDVITGLVVFSTVTAVVSSFFQLAYGVTMCAQVNRQPYFAEKDQYMTVGYVLSGLGFGELFVTIWCGALGCSYLCCQRTSSTEVEELPQRRRSESMELTDVAPQRRGFPGRGTKVVPAAQEVALNDF